MATQNVVALRETDLKSCYPQTAVSQQIIPLSMVRTGARVRVKSIRGKDETRRFLSDLGFVEDAEVSIVSELNGNVIVAIKGTRMAVSKAMASRVMTV